MGPEGQKFQDGDSQIPNLEKKSDQMCLLLEHDHQQTHH